MDLKLLRYFAVLAEEQHFGRAARRLSVSQPPLSLAIRRLEAELGASLFERTSRRVTLTQAGAALQREAQAILRRADDARALVQAVANGARGRLSIGFSGSMIYRGLPRLLQTVGDLSPDLELHLREMNSADQAEALRHDELGVGFLHGQALPGGLDGFRFCVEPFALCLPEGHPSAGLETVDLDRFRALREEPFLLFSRAASPDYYESVIAICLSAGFLPRVACQLRHWLTAIAMVASKAGVALVPACLAGARTPGVVFRPVEPFSPIRSETWCAWRAEHGGQTDLAFRQDFIAAARTLSEEQAFRWPQAREI